MKEVVKSVSHQQVVKLLHNKFVVVLGDSIQRSVYKDLVLLLQSDKYLTASQLRSKGEQSFQQDCLVEGGSLGALHNGTEYREVRQYQSDHHLLRFYFITRIYSTYMKSILSDFRRGPKPDVVIVNSCVWDISRYDSEWLENYKEHLHQFFDDLNGVLPMESLVIWNVTMPLAKKIRGGFLVSEHKAAHLRSDVIEANFFGGTLADGYGLDVLDLHFEFRFSLQHRAKDGVHWNAVAHRRISWLLLQHMAQAWGSNCPAPSLQWVSIHGVQLRTSEFRCLRPHRPECTQRSSTATPPHRPVGPTLTTRRRGAEPADTVTCTHISTSDGLNEARYRHSYQAQKASRAYCFEKGQVTNTSTVSFCIM
uniref:Family with sequence similarity 113 n=1 Tax=Neogobius melanostomus TaxID=47308 RepID=A0A8C6WIS2_9GOBI